MKILNVLCLFCLFICVSCDDSVNRIEATQTEKPSPDEVVSTLAPVSVAVHDFQKVFCMLKMGNNFEEVNANTDFLASKGLPRSITEIPSNPDWRLFEQKFIGKQLEGFSPEQVKLYDQAVYIHLLRNHALLAESDQQERIAGYIKKYMEAGGASAGLLYYGLQKSGDLIKPSEAAAIVTLLKERNEQQLKGFTEERKHFEKPPTLTEEVHQQIVATMDEAYNSEQHYLRLLEQTVTAK